MPWLRGERSNQALAILLAGIVGACGKPPVTGIEIVPFEVVVGADPDKPTTFELEARLWTGEPTQRWSIIESDGYRNLKWKVDQPWVKVVSRTGFRARLEVQAGAPATGLAVVTVKAGGKTTNPGAQISLAPVALTGEDILAANYVPNHTPDAVVIRGIRGATGGPCEVTLSGFVKRASLGKVVAPCGGDSPGWGAAVLSANHRMMVTPVTWSAPDQAVDAAPLQAPLLALPVALHIMVGNSTMTSDELARFRDEVLSVAEADIEVANSLLAEARTGLKVKVSKTSTVLVPDAVRISNCLPGDAVTSGEDELGLLNVYYVNELDEYRGRACDRHESRKQDVIYVSWLEAAGTTLVHEVGHVLGLTQPGAGHSDGLEGFDATNLMASGDDDRDPGGRRRLSVGQAFRVNVDSASWLNWAEDPPGTLIRESTAPRFSCQCGETDPSGQCPRFLDDVARPSGRLPLTHPWECYDQLEIAQIQLAGGPQVQEALPQVDEEAPVAIVAGRRANTPPGTCSDDLRGSTEKHVFETFVRFENLTRPGSCPSWAALFFKQHGVAYFPLAEPGFIWTKTADELVVEDGLPSLVDVPVGMYYSIEHDPKVDLDIAHAIETFGPSSRSGIKLVFDKHTSDCPATSPASPRIAVCYHDGGGSEAGYSSRTIEIWLGKRGPTTISHFLGRVLGLATVTNEVVFPNNIMLGDPDKRGKNLTLGQVYRVSQPLNSSLPACGAGRCPPLEADVPR